MSDYEQRLAERKPHAWELECAECGKRIGWVHSFDLEGSYFWCDDCKAKVVINATA